MPTNKRQLRIQLADNHFGPTARSIHFDGCNIGDMVKCIAERFDNKTITRFTCSPMSRQIQLNREPTCGRG